MSKRIGGVVALVGLGVLSLFLLNCGSSSSRPSGTLYVLTQGSNGVGNNVSSFAIDLNTGGLALVNSNASTCVPAGTSCGAPLDILLDPTGATAFVLNQGVTCVEVFNQQNMVWECDPTSNPPVAPTIYPYPVNSDGSLAAPGTPVTWTCADVVVAPCAYSDAAVAMVRDTAGKFLFVIDQGSFPSPGFPTPSPTNPSCPHVPTSPIDVCPSISVFAISSNTLTLASGGPIYLSKIPTALSAVTFTPAGSTTAQELLFVTNNSDICTANCVLPQHSDNTVSVYAVGSDGTLTEQGHSPYAIAAINPISVLAVETNPPGESTGGLFVYVGNQDTGGGHLYPFEVCTVVDSACTSQDVANTLMVPVATCAQISCNVPPSSVGQKPVALVVDPTNSFIYVVSELSSQVFGFKINTGAGTLTALSPANLPTGSQPVAMALHPSVNNTGQFLYTSNSSSSNITGFTLDTTTGSMFSPITVIAPAQPSGLAVH